MIYINIAVFLAFALLNVISNLFQIQIPPIVSYFMVPADLGQLILQPWSLISYMFLHQGMWHLIINLAWLYFGGSLLLQYFDSKKLLAIYLLGGIAGAAMYILAYNLFPMFAGQTEISKALGASASVLAIVVAIATYIPNYKVRLFLFGKVKLKYIAIIAVIIDVLSLSGGNAGGHFAHLGGAIFGFMFSYQWLKGRDLTARFVMFLNSIEDLFKSKPKKAKMKVKYRSEKASDDTYRKQKAERQQEIDIILDKINKSGYDSLSKKEKEILFNMSKN